MAEQPLVKEDGEDPWKEFKLPFPVATLEDVGLRAYVTPEGTPEWLFSRVHAFCMVASEPGRLLRLNKGKILEDFVHLQVAAQKLHYRGGDTTDTDPNPEAQWKDHTIESGGFLATLLWMMRNRALKAHCKLKAFQLLMLMVEKAFTKADLARPFMAMLTNATGVLVSQELTFSQQELCYTWGQFLNQCPGAVALWTKLGQRCWMNRCIASGLGTATFKDIWMFLAYIWCHPKMKKLGQNLYLCFGKTVLAEFLDHTARWLDAFALMKSQEALKMLPALKTKAGNARKVADPVNRPLLLFKLRKKKMHRREIAETHGELGGGTSRMVVFENYIDVLMHMKAIQKDFANTHQLSVTWDPSTYGGKDILVAIAYRVDQDKAAYLLSQQLGHTVMSELDMDLVGLAKKRQLTRLEGFKEVKGLSCALGSIGLSLEKFRVPQGLICRPLTSKELRIEGPNGQWLIHNEETGEQLSEIPFGLDLGSVPCLLSISDQGPNNMAALNFLAYSSDALMVWPSFDPYHRAWNDIKNALKRSRCKAWRVVLEMTLVANLNYGPFGSSAWHFKKQARLQDFMTCQDISSPMWQKYQHLICQERRIPEPSTLEESQALFDSMRSLESFQQKGPLIKLMRWFSFFESMVFHAGEFWATKMILEQGLGDEAGSEKDIDEAPKEHKDDRKELQELKKRKGTWKLAPELIKERSLSIKDIIVSVGSASWKWFSARARDLLTPFKFCSTTSAVPSTISGFKKLLRFCRHLCMTESTFNTCFQNSRSMMMPWSGTVMSWTNFWKPGP